MLRCGEGGGGGDAVSNRKARDILAQRFDSSLKPFSLFFQGIQNFATVLGNFLFLYSTHRSLSSLTYVIVTVFFLNWIRYSNFFKYYFTAKLLYRGMYFGK